jgi:hypothetical protein
MQGSNSYAMFWFKRMNKEQKQTEQDEFAGWGS